MNRATQHSLAWRHGSTTGRWIPVTGVLIGLLAGAFGLQRAAAAAPARSADPARALKRKLPGPVGQTTLDKALKRYAKLAGVKIDVNWPALKAAGVGKDAKVALKARQATGGQWLDLTLSQVAKKKKPLGWYVHGGVVRVTTIGGILSPRGLPYRRTSRSTRARPTGARPSKSPRPGSVFRFDDTALEDVVEYFREVTGLNFTVNWPALAQANVQRSTEISLNVRNVSPGRALDLVLDQLNAGQDKFGSIYWVIGDEGIVSITTGHMLNTKLIVRVYDVADLLKVVPNVPMPSMSDFSDSGGSDRHGSSGRESGDGGGFGGRSSGRRGASGRDRSSRTGRRSGRRGSSDYGGDRGDEDDYAERKADARDSLIRFIQNSIGEDMWHPQAKGSVTILRGKLIVSQTKLGYKLMGEATRRR